MRSLIRVALFAAGAGLTFVAQAVPLTFTPLTGITGGSPAGTAVFKADLSSAGLGTILSISISDSNSGTGGAGGQFSGFDLDAIKLSTTDCADAACAASAAGISVFDFVSGIAFIPGTQRAPADPKLFGTGPGGNTIDNLVATLGDFDADSIAGLGADGFVSMGDGGVAGFNLTSGVSTAGLFLYIGEVGNNGEVAASSIEIRDTRIPVPEPASLTLLGLGLAVLGLSRRKRA